MSRSSQYTAFTATVTALPPGAGYQEVLKALALGLISAEEARFLAGGSGIPEDHVRRIVIDIDTAPAPDPLKIVMKND